MITDKRVIERLKEYHSVFSPVFLMIHTELSSTKPSIEKIAELLDYNDAEIALLDFCDLIAQVQSIKRKLDPDNRVRYVNNPQEEQWGGTNGS